MHQGFTDNDLRLLESEPGYRSSDPTDEPEPIALGAATLETIRGHLTRTTDGRCKDCRSTIARGDVMFIEGDRLCRPCASDRKVTP
jgi:hypothetical protein